MDPKKQEGRQSDPAGPGGQATLMLGVEAT